MRISDWSSDLYSSDLRRSRMTAGAKVSRLLALDLGTKTGFGVGTPGCVVTGRWDFSPRRFEGGGMRYLRFRRQLDEIHAVTPIVEVAFEEVRRHLGVDAAPAYGGFMAQLTARGEEHGVPYSGVPVGDRRTDGRGKSGQT